MTGISRDKRAGPDFRRLPRQSSIFAGIEDQKLPDSSNPAKRNKKVCSVRLAAWVVSCHNFNLLGFGALDLKARHPENQGCCCQAETFSLDCCSIDLTYKTFAFTKNCHYRSLSMVRDEKSHIRGGAA
jgi:hypothetical protein